MHSTPEHESSVQAKSPTPARSWRRRHPLTYGIIVGLFGAMLVSIGFLIVSMLRRAPQLTRADYEAAVARWESAGPHGYDLDVELGGRRPGKIHVEVRAGEATHMTRDGVVPKQKRTWYYWSVPGMFDTIEQELDLAEDPAASYKLPAGAQVAMWAEFDPKVGYPRRFDRVVLGADLEVHWKVTDFRVVDEKK